MSLEDDIQVQVKFVTGTNTVEKMMPDKQNLWKSVLGSQAISVLWAKIQKRPETRG